MKLRTSHRIITGAAALSLAFATPLALPGVVVPTAMAQTASTITEETASLTIHKYSGATTGAKNDGTELTGKEAPSTPGNEPLSGAKFTVQKINGLDVHKNADWKTVNKAGKDNPETFATEENRNLGDAKELTTNNKGEATASGLKVGFYLVKETDAPEGYSPAKPFIVSLPLTNRDGNGWNYDVHVYPKNKKDFSTEKTVKDATKNAGDKISFDVDADIPAVSGEKLTVMTLTDLMDPRLSIETTDAVTLEIINSTDEYNGDITSDFNINVANKKGANSDQDYVWADAKDAALTKLAAAKKANAAAQIRMTLTPKIKDNLAGLSGEITNTAYVYVGDPAGQGDTKPDQDTPPTPGEDDPGKTPETKTYMGKVQITKKGVENKPVNDATFQLYKCTANGTVDTFGKSNGMAGTTTEGPLTVNGQSEFTSATLEDQKGIVAINGLHVQDFVNGQEVQDSNNSPEGGIPEGTPKAKLTGNNAEGYCLVETKAPVGSERLPEPIFFQVKKEAATTPISFEVQDPDKNAGFELPLTGARGVILFALLGGGLLLLAGFVSRRNKKAAQ